MWRITCFFSITQSYFTFVEYKILTMFFNIECDYQLFPAISRFKKSLQSNANSIRPWPTFVCCLLVAREAMHFVRHVSC